MLRLISANGYLKARGQGLPVWAKAAMLATAAALVTAQSHAAPQSAYPLCNLRNDPTAPSPLCAPCEVWASVHECLSPHSPLPENAPP